MGSSRRITVALIGLVVLVLAGWFVQSRLTDEPRQPPGLSERTLTDLPSAAADTWRLIERGGPFPYPEDDGKVFGNREGLLPDQDRGYYHEYTVETPGSDDRGARRLVTGEADEVYYTGDHYESFVRVDVTR
ncbi:MAG: ribonuclease domain-containing protein [Actinophytocola sp.]|uniref:ribonuclease domain-containing protein n=1 Tax=Actinophytocola sp. TaxID=1872138 RepID=UPI003C763D49